MTTTPPLTYCEEFLTQAIAHNNAQWLKRITALESALKKTNDQAEHFEREWYLRGDAIEKLEADRKMLREALATLLVRFDPHVSHNYERSLAAEKLAQAALEKTK